jgi:hypothetical protein
MESDFAAKLKAAIGTRREPENSIVVPKAAPFPGNFKGTIQEAFNRYCTEYAGKDFEDPRGICVSLFEYNFPKLVKLLYKPNSKTPETYARAKGVLESMRNGSFDETKHRSEQPARLQTLFWIDDVLCRPHGIHPNCAARVEGEEVYFKRYARSGSDIKLVFTAIGNCGNRIVITSFFDVADNLKKYCGLPALWLPK